jgi:ABC-type Fe3+/spermidine/putrescine transport system ATPase subunit
MSSLALQGIEKAFGSTAVLRGINLAIPRGEFFSLLGPSGCGKSTLLRVIAGLESADRGSISIDDKPINHIPPQRRGIGMVFQQYALWPHMTIEQNVRFGLEAQSLTEHERDLRMTRALERVQMLTYRKRYPHEISGGQQQRVALARALALEPAIILLDEPLSNLDARLRREIRQELSDLHRALGTTTVYVTHDQEDALALSSRIAVMHNGAIQQVGPPREIFERPSSVFTARFIGDANLLPCTVRAAGACMRPAATSPEASLISVELDDLPGAILAAGVASRAYHIGARGYLCIRPHAVKVDEGGSGETSRVLPAHVQHVTYRGGEYELELNVSSGTRLKASIPAAVEAPCTGQPVALSWDPQAAVFVPAEI